MHFVIRMQTDVPVPHILQTCHFPVNQSYHFVPNKLPYNHNSSVTLLRLSDSCIVLITATDDDTRTLFILIVL